MTWEELKEKAKELGFTISYYLKDYDGVEKEIGYIYCNDYIYLEEDGDITTSTENIVAENRTPDQMYQIMLALRQVENERNSLIFNETKKQSKMRKVWQRI